MPELTNALLVEGTKPHNHAPESSGKSLPIRMEVIITKSLMYEIQVVYKFKVDTFIGRIFTSPHCNSAMRNLDLILS